MIKKFFFVFIYYLNFNRRKNYNITIALFDDITVYVMETTDRAPFTSRCYKQESCHDNRNMEFSRLTDSPCLDFHQLTISCRRRRTVNRQIRFHNGADSTDIIVTSSVSTSNEC